MKKIRLLNGLSSIFLRERKYKAVFMDAYGVFNFGTSLCPKTLAWMKERIAEGFLVIVVSNSSATVEVEIRKYAKKGLYQDVHYTDFITSGEYLSIMLDQAKADVGNSVYVYGQANFKRPYDPIPDALKNAVAKNTMQIVSNINDADSIYAGIPRLMEEPDQELEFFSKKQKDLLIKEISELGTNKLMFTANPDYMAFENVNGERLAVVRMGSCLEAYQKLGGKVQLFGKPGAGIFEYVANKHNLTKQEILMVGDTIGTDILGANRFGCDSLLLTHNGVSEELSQRNQGMSVKDTILKGTFSDENIPSMLSEAVYPTIVFSDLKPSDVLKALDGSFNFQGSPLGKMEDENRLAKICQYCLNNGDNFKAAEEVPHFWMIEKDNIQEMLVEYVAQTIFLRNKGFNLAQKETGYCDDAENEKYVETISTNHRFE